MLRTLYVSFLISLLSLILIFVFPMIITIHESSYGPSPYYSDILKLREKMQGGLRPSAPEWSQLEILKHKNRMWFDQQERNNTQTVSAEVLNYFKVKSAKLSLMLFTIWLVSFYYFFRKNVSTKHLLVLGLPVVFLLLDMLALMPFIFIVGGVISAFSLLKWRAHTHVRNG